MKIPIYHLGVDELDDPEQVLLTILHKDDVKDLYVVDDVVNLQNQKYTLSFIRWLVRLLNLSTVEIKELRKMMNEFQLADEEI